MKANAIKFIQLLTLCTDGNIKKLFVRRHGDEPTLAVKWIKWEINCKNITIEEYLQHIKNDLGRSYGIQSNSGK